MNPSEWAFWLALLVMLIGLVGVVVPGLPGTPLIMATAVVYAFAEDFATIPPETLLVMGLLMALGFAVDLVATNVGSKLGGASWRAVFVGFVFGVVGLVAGLLLGGIGAVPLAMLASLAGILLVEYLRRRSLGAAVRAGAGWLAGCVVSTVVQFGLGIVMISVFVWQAARG